MPNLSDVALGIKIAMNAGTITEFPRPYLGMSQLGNPCARRLWMYFRWAAQTKYKKKSRRIFERGDIEEQRVLQYWREIGIKIEDTQRTLIGCDGHLKGHTDGVLRNIPGIEDVPMVGEIKSMAHKYFVPLTKKGLKASKPEYYSQAQIYMHYEGLKHCLHHTTNKNDEDFYIEIIEYDKDHAEDLDNKARDIIFSAMPPRKISEDPTYWMCQWCDFYGPCQLNDNFLRTCRTCQHSTPAPGGKWECSEHSKELTIDEQKAACTKYDCLKV